MTTERLMFCVWAIRIMRTRRDNATRLRNFIRMNFGRNIRKSTALRIWAAYADAPIQQLNPEFYRELNRGRYRKAQQSELARINGKVKR